MQPPDDNQIIWRYMDIPSFLSFIITENLPFVRTDLMEDKSEGNLPVKIREILKNKFAEQNTLLSILNHFKQNKFRTYINCWCIEKYQMLHMWKIYSKINGIAIETTYGKLKEAIDTDEFIFATEINYINFQEELVNLQSNSLTPFTIKREEYKSEQEIRLLIQNPLEIDELLPKDLETGMRFEDKNTLKLYLERKVINCKINVKI